MSSAWPLVALGEVLTHRKEFIQINDLDTYKRCRVQLHAQGIVLRDSVVGVEIKTKKQQVCKAGEFLVAEIDAKVGGFGIVPVELNDAIVSSHYFLFGINESKMDRRFLDFYSRTPAFREQVAAQGSTNYAAIRPKDVLGYTIPLPSLAEQQRIVTRIEELAAKINEARGLRRQAVEEAEALLHSTSRQLFSMSKDHGSAVLASLCTDIIDCLHSNAIYSDSGIPTLRSPDIGWGKLLPNTALKTSEDEYLRRTRRGELVPGDIIIVREGGGTGKAGIVEEGQKMSLGQRVMQVRPDSRKILPHFLLYQWLSPIIQQDHIVPLSKGSASPHLNIGAIRKFPIMLPSIEEQHSIVAYLDNLHAKVDSLKRLQTETSAELDAMLPSILDKAFRGDL
jgi:type I restriction enzyme S subunit